MAPYNKTEALVLLTVRAYPDELWNARTLSQWLEIPRDDVNQAIDRLMECGEIMHVDGAGYKDAS